MFIQHCFFYHYINICTSWLSSITFRSYFGYLQEIGCWWYNHSTNWIHKLSIYTYLVINNSKITLLVYIDYYASNFDVKVKFFIFESDHTRMYPWEHMNSSLQENRYIILLHWNLSICFLSNLSDDNCNWYRRPVIRLGSDIWFNQSTLTLFSSWNFHDFVKDMSRNWKLHLRK